MSLETNSSTTLRIPKGFEKFGEDLFYHLSNFLSVIDLISLSHTCNFLHNNCKPLVYPQFKTRATAHILNLKKKRRYKRNKKNIHDSGKNINTTELLETIQNPRETDIGVGGSFPLYVLLENPKWDYNDIDVFHMRDTIQYNYGGKCKEYGIASRYNYQTCRHGYFNLIVYGLDCDILDPMGMKEDSTVADSCFDRFDISVVKVVWSADSLNIKNVRDIYHKTMHVNFSGCRIDRIIKYKQRGFKISKKHESRINQKEYKRKIYNMYKYFLK